MVAVHPSFFKTVTSIFIIVDFPAPLGPRSPSISPSLSPSISPSPSPSVSPSASPSPGWEGYSRGDYAVLPSDDANLETAYAAQDYLDVDTSDDTRVGQTASGEYAIHEFKDYVGDLASATLHWEGQTNQACSISPVVLEIYNQNTATWDNVYTDDTSPADADFVIEQNIPDLTNYKTGSKTISCRVYQLHL